MTYNLPDDEDFHKAMSVISPEDEFMASVHAEARKLADRNDPILYDATVTDPLVELAREYAGL